MKYMVWLRCRIMVFAPDFCVEVEAEDETEAAYRAKQILIGPPGSSFFSPPQFDFIKAEEIQQKTAKEGTHEQAAGERDIQNHGPAL